MRKLNCYPKVMIPVLIVMMVQAGWALAQGAKGVGYRGCNGRGSGGERMAECLDLTEEQQIAISEIRSEAQTANLDLRKNVQRLQNQLEGELLADNPTEKRVLDLAAKLDAVRAQQHANRLKMRLAIREQLTPGQRDKMTVMQNRKGGQRGRHNGRMCKGGSGQMSGKCYDRGESQRGSCGSGR